MKDKYIKLKAMLLAGTIALTSAGLSGCSSKNNNNEDESIIIEDRGIETKLFGVGEHIISVPVSNPIYNAMQYQYHEGYEVVGIATADFNNTHAGACVLYVNKEPVTCTLTEIKDGKELYLSFGVPVEKEMTKSLN